MGQKPGCPDAQTGPRWRQIADVFVWLYASRTLHLRL